ncbi:hypothetical protein [Halovenus salina]|uniref:Uncharacterized protein n=1 Tax=Halovenus salina TaxID=1510225 RepID=A0ABD5VYJ9_9EURY
MVLGGAFEQNIIQDFEDDDGEPGMLVNTQQTGNGGFRFIPDPIYTETDVANLESIDGVDFVGPEARLSASQFVVGDTRQTGGFSVQAVSPDQYDSGDMLDGELFDGGDEAILTQALVNMTDGQALVGDQIRVSFDDGTAEEFMVTGIVEESFGTGPSAGIYLSLDHHYNTTIETPEGPKRKPTAR